MQSDTHLYEFDSSYHFKLHNIPRPYLWYLSTSSHFLNSLVVYNLQKNAAFVNMALVYYIP